MSSRSKPSTPRTRGGARAGSRGPRGPRGGGGTSRGGSTTSTATSSTRRTINEAAEFLRRDGAKAKPRSQYDLMMYDAFSENPFESHHLKATGTKYPIIPPSYEPAKKKGFHKEHNLALIPEFSHPLDGSEDSASQDSTESANAETGKPKIRENANSLIEARNKFRTALKNQRVNSPAVNQIPDVQLLLQQKGILTSTPVKNPPNTRKNSKRNVNTPTPTLLTTTTLSQLLSDAESGKKNRPVFTAHSEALRVGNNMMAIPQAPAIIEENPEEEAYDPNARFYFPQVSGDWILERNAPLYQKLTHDVTDKGRLGSLYRMGREYAKEHWSFRSRKEPATRPAPVSTLPNRTDFDGPYSELPGPVYHLPKADPAPLDPETGRPINLRIPKFIREYQKPETFTDVALEFDSLSEFTGKELLNHHKAHWKSIRQKFEQAEAENRERYRHSFGVLERMYVNRHTGGDPNVKVLKNPPYEKQNSMVTIKEEDEDEEVGTVVGDKKNEQKFVIREIQIRDNSLVKNSGNPFKDSFQDQIYASDQLETIKEEEEEDGEVELDIDETFSGNPLLDTSFDHTHGLVISFDDGSPLYSSLRTYSTPLNSDQGEDSQDADQSQEPDQDDDDQDQDQDENSLDILSNL